jgi:hypothetical protein
MMRRVFVLRRHESAGSAPAKCPGRKIDNPAKGGKAGSIFVGRLKRMSFLSLLTSFVWRTRQK